MKVLIAGQVFTADKAGSGLAAYYAAKGQAAGRFSPVGGGPVPGQSCSSCLRRQMSFPDTCNDGWPCGDPDWQDRGAWCCNFLGKEGRP